MKEQYIQLHDIVAHHPNLMGLHFNLVDRTDCMVVHLHNYILDHHSDFHETPRILDMIGTRGKSLTVNRENIAKIHERPIEQVRIQHLLSRVIDDPFRGSYQLLVSVIHDRIHDQVMAYRAPPLRLFMGEDGKSWMEIEQLAEPLVGEERNQELFNTANLNIPVRPPLPPKSFRPPTTHVSYSA